VHGLRAARDGGGDERVVRLLADAKEVDIRQAMNEKLRHERRHRKRNERG
jgi:hypothetical protein